MNLTRRSFLKGAGTAATAALTGCRTLAPTDHQTAAAKNRLCAPDRKLRIACVGVAGRGAADLNAVRTEDIVALCDVDAQKLSRQLATCPQAKPYKDYRKLLTDLADDLDAVVIATPDHMHFPIARMAMEMGKHVFVEKPCAHTVWECRELARIARECGVQTQMGNQGHATSDIRRARAWIDQGALGDVTEVQVYTDRPIWKQNCAWPQPGTCPDWLDWNLWCGTGPLRPCPQGGMAFRWRGFWDYGCGALGDMGCHCLDAACWALNLTRPDWIEAESDARSPELTPNWSIITYHFPQRGKLKPMLLRWYDGKRLPPRPPQLEQGRNLPAGSGSVFYGTEGNMMVGGWSHSPRIFPEARMREVGKPKNMLPTVPGGCHQEWIRACKGGPAPGSNFCDYATGLTELALLGNIAVRAGRRIHWNPDTLSFDGNDYATALVTHAYRDF